MLDLPIDHLASEREHFVESLHVVEVDVVHAAPADVVVGMVLEQGIPRGLEQRRLDAGRPLTLAQAASGSTTRVSSDWRGG